MHTMTAVVSNITNNILNAVILAGDQLLTTALTLLVWCQEGNPICKKMCF